MGKKHFVFYCIIIAIIICTPLLCTALNVGSKLITDRRIIQEDDLRGVYEKPKITDLTLDTLLSRQFQTEFEKYVEFQITPRLTLTRVYNQLLHTAFHSTDSKSVLIGRDDYLFEKNYPTAFFSELTPIDKANLEIQINKTHMLKELLKQRGITLVVRMSPSKAAHYSEFLPRPYDRFNQMKKSGEYGDNWYQAFTKIIHTTDIPFYDRNAYLQDLKHDGKIVFAKGGTHWTLLPLAEYINGLNMFIEDLTGKKLGRIVISNEEVITGRMGTVDDCDIWNICWNAVSVSPDYPSPNITFQTIPGDSSLRVFTVGQSFTWGLLNTVYSSEHPVWSETYFSYYNGKVHHYNSETPRGVQISDKTEDYEQYLKMDIVMIEFLESGPGDQQFEFVDHLLQYLQVNGAE